MRTLFDTATKASLYVQSISFGEASFERQSSPREQQTGGARQDSEGLLAGPLLIRQDAVHSEAKRDSEDRHCHQVESVGETRSVYAPSVLGDRSELVQRVAKAVHGEPPFMQGDRVDWEILVALVMVDLRAQGGQLGSSKAEARLTITAMKETKRTRNENVSINERYLAVVGEGQESARLQQAARLTNSAAMGRPSARFSAKKHCHSQPVMI